MAKVAATLLAVCAAAALIAAAAAACILQSRDRMVSYVHPKKARSHDNAMISTIDTQCLK